MTHPYTSECITAVQIALFCVVVYHAFLSEIAATVQDIGKGCSLGRILFCRCAFVG